MTGFTLISYPKIPTGSTSSATSLVLRLSIVLTTMRTIRLFLAGGSIGIYILLSQVGFDETDSVELMVSGSIFIYGHRNLRSRSLESHVCS